MWSDSYRKGERQGAVSPQSWGQWGEIAEPPAGAEVRSLGGGGAKENAPVERELPVRSWRGTEQPLRFDRK